MIHWLNKQDDMWEGSFQSRFFRNEANQTEMFICIQNPDAAAYAERCAEHFNALPEAVIDTLCMRIMKCAAQGGIAEEFELPEITDAREILQYCWFTTLYAEMPEEEGEISYIAEGEGEWGEVIGFVIRNSKLAYVGVDYFDTAEGE